MNHQINSNIENKSNLKYFSETREARAKQILEHSKPECLDENTFLVPSQFDSNKKYQVTYFDSYSCNCKDFELRCKGKGLYCKHIKVIQLFQKLKNKLEIQNMLLNSIKINNSRNLTGEENLIKTP